MYEDNCPKQYKCVYNPWSKEPSIDDVVDSLNSIKKQRLTCQEVQKDGVVIVIVDVIVISQSAIAHAQIVTARKMKFKHENYTIDLTASNKAKLYYNNQLVFIGDGYKAITAMLNGSQDKEPVKKKFKAQLMMRQKPKFTVKKDSMEALKREALAALEPKKKKR